MLRNLSIAVMLALTLGILWTRLIRKSVGGTQANVQAYASTYPQPYTQPNMPQLNIQS
jgi:hypothetical protein